MGIEAPLSGPPSDRSQLAFCFHLPFLQKTCYLKKRAVPKRPTVVTLIGCTLQEPLGLEQVPLRNISVGGHPVCPCTGHLVQ